MITALLSALLLTSAPARAADCPCAADRVELQGFRDKLANAATPEDARHLALEKTRLGHKAIRQVAKVAHGDPGITEADDRLSAFEGGVARAGTQEDVAHQFDVLMAADVADGHCAYTNVEIAIIIVGFLLGIIPGIIFLFLFC